MSSYNPRCPLPDGECCGRTPCGPPPAPPPPTQTGERMSEERFVMLARAYAEGSDSAAEQLIDEALRARERESAHSDELAQVRARLEEAEKQRDDFRRFGQQFERDARAHFEQSCANLRRANSAEEALKIAKDTLIEAEETLSVTELNPEALGEAEAELDLLTGRIRAALTTIRERTKA